MSIKNIRNLRKNLKLGLLSLTAMLFLTSCQKNEEDKVIKEETAYEEETLEIASQEEINNSLYNQNLEEQKEFIDNLRENKYGNIDLETIEIHYYFGDYGKDIRISKNEKTVSQEEISQEIYDKINLIIEELEINTIYFNEIKDQIDFSKINFNNIEKISFDNFKGTFDSKKTNAKNIKSISITSSNQATFDFSNFNTQIGSYHFHNATIKNIKNCFSNNAEDLYISWEEDRETNKELKSVLEYFYQNNIVISTLIVCEWNNAGDNAVTKEDFDLLGKLNTSCLYIEVDGIQQPFNLEMNLNKEIKNVDVYVYNNHQENSYGELGTIKIKSDNENFHCSFDYGNITKNTSFSLPNSASISLGNLDCTSIQAFYDLKNVSYLWFKEDNDRRPEADNRGEIRYDKNDDCTEYYDAMAGIYLPLYTDYNKVLKDLEYYFKLKQLKQKLNVSSMEQERYYAEASIGDYIQLENGRMGCISSIVLVKDEYEIVVDNMEDYEDFISIGFIEKGYNIVKNSNDIPYNEKFVEEEDFKLIFTPFK